MQLPATHIGPDPFPTDGLIKGQATVTPGIGEGLHIGWGGG